MLQDGHVSNGQGELKISLGPVRLAEVDPTQTNHVKGFANFVAAGERLQEAVEFVSGDDVRALINQVSGRTELAFALFCDFRTTRDRSQQKNRQQKAYDPGGYPWAWRHLSVLAENI